ncbi:hypothetical protein [Bhargavaea beijingensis]|uniref:Uncharacterized protein n=1 Tax=Bhargavaea beijingensis TaxID=426756 RepID=A0A1G7FE70_9BACL|nr:hypothetical protein [Bhargavaea beijingensis]MCW1929427.1 hypothetical protein [Bhargavaea beijingensis]RSK29660.1 hypothetical protein EJA12_11270 [Bhargavaea beijingensis]SDE74164.1 hypothetical protein SAMN04488126_11827 [Bhargavaea beijingensis]
MSDPTIFENLKVAFENHFYNLDNLDGRILITGRSDLMDLADLSRTLVVRFVRTDRTEVPVEVELCASARDLAGEILEVEEAEPGVTLRVRFDKPVTDPAKQCERIGAMLADLWERDIRLTQTLSFDYPQGDKGWTNRVEAEFNTRLDEEHMGSIREFAESVMIAAEKMAAI